jgi:integrase
MIKWQAFTCMRTGETLATHYSVLEGDTYHLRAQYNAKLRRETPPKYSGVGTIYVPEPARRAVLDKPRRLGDDLMFRTKRGGVPSGEPAPCVDAGPRGVMAQLPAGHHLHQRLSVDDEDRMAFYELRHSGASYMLNVLELEPWVIAEQLRQSDGGVLVVKLYGHPSREAAIERMRRAYTARVEPIRGITPSEPSAAEGNRGTATNELAPQQAYPPSRTFPRHSGRARLSRPAPPRPREGPRRPSATRSCRRRRSRS